MITKLKNIAEKAIKGMENIYLNRCFVEYKNHVIGQSIESYNIEYKTGNEILFIYSKEIPKINKLKAYIFKLSNV